MNIVIKNSLFFNIFGSHMYTTLKYFVLFIQVKMNRENIRCVLRELLIKQLI